MNIIRHLGILIFVVIFSCNYEPDGLYFTELSKPTLLGLDVNLNNADDTIYLFSKTTFTYRAELGNRKLKRMLATFNGQSLFFSTSPVNSFTLDPIDYDAGTYSIDVSISATSATGSFADKFDKEIVESSEQWILIVDKSPPTPVNILEILPEGGTLKIKIEKYPRKNFQAYVVEKYCYIPNYGYSQCATFTITHQDEPILHDTTYLNGRVRFDVKVRASDQMSDVTSSEFNYQWDNQIQWEMTGAKTGKFTWRSTPFYKNFKAYNFGPFLSAPSFKSSNVKDTTAAFSLTYNNFSTDIGFELVTISKGTDRRTDAKTLSTVYNGNKFYRFSSVRYNKASNNYYVWSGRYLGSTSIFTDSLFQVDASTSQVKNKLAFKQPYYFALSEDGTILYVAKDNIIQRLDPNTFEVISTFDFSTLENTYTAVFARLTMQMHVSNNNILIIPSFYAQYVVDMNTLTLLHKNGSNNGILAISPDAQKIFRLGTVYNKVGQSYSIGTSLISNTSLQTIQYLNVDSAVAIYDNKVVVFNPTSGALINELILAINSNIRGYDEVSKLFYSYQYNSNLNQDFNIYNLRDNSLRTIKVNDTYYRLYSLLNGTLLCSSGYSLSQP